MHEALRRKGHGEPVLAKARELTDLSALIVRSHWNTGWDELDVWREKNGHASWIADLPDTSYTGVLMRFPRSVAQPIGQFVGPRLDKGVSFDYEPLPMLQGRKVPRLWVMGVNDVSAPAASTLRILNGLQQSGAPIDVALHQNADHGMLVSLSDRGPPYVLAHGYLDLVAKWSATRDLRPVPATGAWQHFERRVR
jgi:hypothetical protein